MKPLIVLLVTFGITTTISKIFYHQWNVEFAGNFAMSIMLFFTAMAHFAFNKGMAMMLPSFVPFKRQTVHATGLIEILAGIGLLVKPYRHMTSILLIIFFVLILPANIYAAINKVNYEKGNHSGNDVRYLWFRIPLQIFFIEWVWYFGL
ncbi:MAG TPA: hypothetical protein VGQ53_11555 [Chitinophagaceae bacterium]|jgi:uncharacterized membrane protein|nr:hypothetical protein [Chitinophagaceae bacterium]